MPRQTDAAAGGARALGVSIDTLRRWDRAGKIRVERDEANRRVVPAAEVERLRGASRDETLSAGRRFAGGLGRGLGVDELAGGALLMGAIFLVLGASGLIDLAARAFPKPVVRGVQLTVGILFLEIAWKLVREPPAAFHLHGLSRGWLLALALLVLGSLALPRRVPAALVLAARAGGAGA